MNAPEIKFETHYMTRPRWVEMLIEHVAARKPVVFQLDDGTKIRVKLLLVESDNDGTITFKVASVA